MIVCVLWSRHLKSPLHLTSGLPPTHSPRHPRLTACNKTILKVKLIIAKLSWPLPLLHLVESSALLLVQACLRAPSLLLRSGSLSRQLYCLPRSSPSKLCPTKHSARPHCTGAVKLLAFLKTSTDQPSTHILLPHSHTFSPVDKSTQRERR